MVILAPSRTDYDAVADIILDLPRLLLDARARLGITAKVQAAQIGISLTTLNRVTDGGSNPTQATIIACLRWLGTH